MAETTERRGPIEITGQAREALLGHLQRDGKARYVRIHVGRG